MGTKEPEGHPMPPSNIPGKDKRKNSSPADGESGRTKRIRQGEVMKPRMRTKAWIVR